MASGYENEGAKKKGKKNIEKMGRKEREPKRKRAKVRKKMKKDNCPGPKPGWILRLRTCGEEREVQEGNEGPSQWKIHDKQSAGRNAEGNEQKRLRQNPIHSGNARHEK